MRLKKNGAKRNETKKRNSKQNDQQHQNIIQIANHYILSNIHALHKHT